MREDLAAIRRDGIRHLKSYLRAGEGEQTALLREIAGIIVEARGCFPRQDGSPDWNGRSYAYRQWVRDLFNDAGVRDGALKTVQSAVRYHVGAVLRENLDEETLADYGLISETPRERAAGRRQGKAALLQAFQSRDVSGGSLAAITAAQTVLARVVPKDTDDLDAEHLAVAEESLADLERRVRALRRRIASRQ